MHLVGGGEVCSVWRRSVRDQRVFVGRSVSSQSSFKQGLNSEFFWWQGSSGKVNTGISKCSLNRYLAALAQHSENIVPRRCGRSIALYQVKCRSGGEWRANDAERWVCRIVRHRNLVMPPDGVIAETWTPNPGWRFFVRSSDSAFAACPLHKQLPLKTASRRDRVRAAMLCNRRHLGRYRSS